MNRIVSKNRKWPVAARNRSHMSCEPRSGKKNAFENFSDNQVRNILRILPNFRMFAHHKFFIFDIINLEESETTARLFSSSDQHRLKT